MTPFPYFVEVGDSLLVARALMVRHDVRHLPVKEGNELVGVLTDRDLKRALDPDLGLPPKDELFVRDVFVPDAFTVDTSEPLDRVLEEMANRHMGCVLVTSHGRLAGIFTTTDACRVLCEHLRALAPPHPGDQITRPDSATHVRAFPIVPHDSSANPSASATTVPTPSPESV